jgi:hypothetical protein
LLATATTSLGFASLAVARMPILRSFGLWAAVGIVLGFVVVVTVVPALLSFVTDLSPKRSPPTRPPAVFHAPLRRPWLTLGITAVLVGLAAWGSTRVVVDNRLTALLDADHPTSVASRIVDERLGGILSLEVELRGPDGRWTSPEGRRRIAALSRWATEQPQVRAVLGPQTPGIGDQFVSADGSRARLSIRVADTGGRAFALFEDQVTREVGDDGIVTGTSAIAYRGVNRMTRDLRVSLLLVFVVVTVVITVLTRSLRSGLVSIPPNLLPLGLGYGALGLLGIELDPLAAVVLVVALGIAVDDTIHLLARWQHERRAAGPDQAIAIALARTGRAVTITTAVLAAGLAVNLLSSFPPLRLLGALGAAVMAAALAADLWLLPALLVVTGRRSRDGDVRRR